MVKTKSDRHFQEMATGDDIAISFSPDGRLFQIEYAEKAVEKDSLALGVRCSDGILFAAEKNLQSSLIRKASNPRSFLIDENIGAITIGHRPDCYRAVVQARKEAADWVNGWGSSITVPQLVNRLSLSFYQQHSTGGGIPYGCAILLGSHKDHQLYAIEPSGKFYGYFASAFGKSASLARAELQRIEWKEITVRDAIPELAKIIQGLHDSQNKKKWEIEMQWICDESNGIPQTVPEDVFNPSQE